MCTSAPDYKYLGERGLYLPCPFPSSGTGRLARAKAHLEEVDRGRRWGAGALAAVHTLQTMQIPQGGRRAIRLRALRG